MSALDDHVTLNNQSMTNISSITNEAIDELHLTEEEINNNHGNPDGNQSNELLLL